MRDHGARLTHAEQHRLKSRWAEDEARDLYVRAEAVWTEAHYDTFERKSQYTLALRRERDGDTDLGRSWRLWQRARRWEAIWEITFQNAKRAYYDSPTMGRGR